MSNPTQPPITLPTDVLAGLYAIGTGQVQHVFMGLCPDEVEGIKVRDDECPACRVLMAADKALAAAGDALPFAAALNELTNALEAGHSGEEEGEHVGNPAAAALAYALEHGTEEPLEFLRCWYQGDFDAIRNEWPDAPAAVFISADPLYKPA